jgi:succinoglycan biosynthesis protein ExoA
MQVVTDVMLDKPNPARVTVIMPVRNEALHIITTLRQIINQERAGIELEVLVVDGQSTDCTRELTLSMCKEHPEITLLDNPRRLSSAARNVGIRHSTGDYLVIVDGHCEIPSTRYLVDLVDAFDESGADCLGRPQPLEVSAASTLQQAIAIARSSWLGHHPDSFIFSDVQQVVPADSVAVAYRREVFMALGLFDERFDACEDGEFNHRVDRAGMTCVFDPRLRVNYAPRDSLRGLFKQLYRYGRGRVRLARKHSSTFSWKSFVPAAFVMGVTLGPLACYWSPSLWWPYLGTIGVYLTALVAVAVRSSWGASKGSLLLWLPLVFVTIHLGAALGSLRELFRPLKPLESNPWQAPFTNLFSEVGR